jgi:hypothetical protein
LSTGESSNFYRHPSFPILLNQLLISTRSLPLPVLILSGTEFRLPSYDDYRTVRIHQSYQIYPKEFHYSWPATWEDTTVSGLYKIEFEDFAGRKYQQIIGVNSGDESESNIKPQIWNEQVEAVKQKSQMVNDFIDLKPWLIGVIILLLFVETVFAWRH